MAIGTPSSGVKPIVVSIERPSSTAVTEQPPPRWQATIRAASSCDDDRLHGDPVEPVAAHAPVAPALRDRVRRGLAGESSSGTPCRRPRRAARPGRAARASRIARRAGVLWSGAMRDSSSIASSTSIVDQHRLRVPRPSVHDAMTDSVRRREAVHGSRLFALDEAELQARRARVDREDGAQRVSTARPSRARTARPRRAPASRPGSAGAPRPCPVAARTPSRPAPARGR